MISTEIPAKTPGRQANEPWRMGRALASFWGMAFKRI